MKGFLTLIVFVLVAGCRGEAADPSGTDRIVQEEEWLTVTSDARMISNARQMADENQRKEYEQVFESLGAQYFFLDSEAIALLDSRREESTARLKSFLSDDGIAIESVRAAAVLCMLRIPEGRRFLATALEQGSAEIRLAALKEIPSIDYDPAPGGAQSMTDFLNADERLTAALIRQLDSDDRKIVEEAIQVCGAHHLPGWHERFVALLRHPDPPGRNRLFYWLSKEDISEELFNTAVSASQEPSGKGPPDGLDIIEACARSENVEFRRLACTELKRILADWAGDDDYGFRGDRLGTIDSLATACTAEDVAWLTEAVHREQGLYRKAFMMGLMRLEGDKARQRLLQMLGDPEQRSDAVSLAAEVFAGSRDAELVDRLVSTARSADEDQLSAVCRALLEIDGEHAEAELLALTGRMSDSNKAYFQEMLGQYALADIQRDVVEAGLLDAATAEETSAEIRATPQEDGGEPPGLVDFLMTAEIGVSFDAETDALPCRHDQLVRDFAKCSRGIFSPEAVSEQWHQSDPDDFDAAYTLRFIFHGRLYQGRMRKFGDWYDVERTVRMINQSMEDAGRPERFLGLAAEGQVAMFLFGDPRQLEPLAKKYSVALSADLNRARQSGREYEQQVIESMEKGVSPK